jgi:Tfp pilus assembly PilM family ATPase
VLRTCKTGWVGFDVGAASVKAAQLVRKGGEYYLRTAAVAPRRTPWTADVLAAQAPPASADELQSAASLCDRLAPGPAAALLPASACELLQINAAVGKRGGAAPDLIRSVETESQRSMRHRVLDAWPIDENNRRLNVVTAPKPWADQLSADVAAAGRRCRVLDALPWALARAARLAGDAETDPARPFVALDWGYSRATLVFVDRGVPAHVRLLRDCGYEQSIAAAERELRLPTRDAEIVLARHGFAAGAGAASTVAAVLTRPFDRLIAEIRRTFGYWQGLTRGASPVRIVVFGGGGALAGVDRKLSEALAIDAVVWRLPFEAAGDAGERHPTCLYGAAAGLSALAWEGA